MKPAVDFTTELAAPARRALQGAGLTTLAKLTRSKEAEVLALHGMAPNAIGSLREALKKKGLQFSRR